MRKLGLASVALAIAIVSGLLLKTIYISAHASGSNEISVQDRQQILDLISRYGHAWDNKDSEAWVALFTDDAILQNYGAGRLLSDRRTNADRLDRAKERHAMFADKGIQTRHFQTNTLLTSRPDGSVSGETTFSVTWQHGGEQTPKLVHTGVYRDIYLKTASAWKFARREVRFDHK